MRKALIEGIDYYTYARRLNGCVNDAFAVRQVLVQFNSRVNTFFGCFVCFSLAIVVPLQRYIYNNVYEEVRFGPSRYLCGAAE